MAGPLLPAVNLLVKFLQEDVPIDQVLVGQK
jgi:hypothetical protein